MRSPEKALQPTPRRSFSIAWDERDVDGSPPLFEVTTATIATGRTAANRAKSPLPLRWIGGVPLRLCYPPLPFSVGVLEVHQRSLREAQELVKGESSLVGIEPGFVRSERHRSWSGGNHSKSTTTFIIVEIVSREK
nr:hypothetical protein Iba_chr11eCG2350 [Ipomoea batatas]